MRPDINYIKFVQKLVTKHHVTEAGSVYVSCAQDGKTDVLCDIRVEVKDRGKSIKTFNKIVCFKQLICLPST